MDLAFNKLQMLTCHKFNQPTNQPTNFNNSLRWMFHIFIHSFVINLLIFFHSFVIYLLIFFHSFVIYLLIFFHSFVIYLLIFFHSFVIYLLIFFHSFVIYLLIFFHSFVIYLLIFFQHNFSFVNSCMHVNLILSHCNYILFFFLFQVSYTFCKDFLSALLKSMSSTEFGTTTVLIKAFQRVNTNLSFATPKTSLPKVGILRKKLNSIRSWASSSGDLGSVESLVHYSLANSDLESLYLFGSHRSVK